MNAERVLPELEAYITGLKAHRSKLSEQPVFPWHWLAEKGGEYYRMRNDPKTIGYDAEQSKNKAWEYCTMLSQEHLVQWMAIGKINWMIHDGEKRIAQHKMQPRHSTEEDAPPYVTWPPNRTAPALQRPPELFLRCMRKHQQKSEMALQTVGKAIEGLKHDVDDPKMPNMPPEAKEVLRKHPSRRQEVERLVREGQEERAKVAIMTDAIEILRDGEAKAGEAKGLTKL